MKSEAAILGRIAALETLRETQRYSVDYVEITFHIAILKWVLEG